MSTDLPDFIAAATPAARWWVDQIRDVKAEPDGIHPGLTTEQAFTALAGVSLRAQQIKSVTAPDDTVLAAFARELTRAIAATTDRRLNLFVDYGPDPVLRQAATEADVSTALFPNKTRMQVWRDHVLAKAGYDAHWRLVWSAPDWEHPACGVQDWPESAEDPTGPECARPRWHDGQHDWQRG